MNHIAKISVFFIILMSLQSCSTLSNDVVIRLSEKDCNTHGKKVDIGNIPTPAEIAKDAYCAKRLAERNAPHGVITIFGSSRSKTDNPNYISTRTFAREWTKVMGNKYPILTGGGGGNMAAGNQGAHEAGGKSLAFSSHFKKVPTENLNPYITDGYIASSFSQREADMVDYAAAVIITSGGIGTEWEIFETLAKIQTRKIHPIPVILLGKREFWQTLLDRLNHLNNIKTISPRDLNIIQIAESPEIAIEILKKQLP